MARQARMVIVVGFLTALLSACSALLTDSEIQATQMAQASDIGELLLRLDGIERVYEVKLEYPPYENYDNPVFVFAYMIADAPVDEAVLPEQIKATIADYFDETFDNVNMDVHIVYGDVETVVKGEYIYVDRGDGLERQDGGFQVTTEPVRLTTLYWLTETPEPVFPTLTPSAD